jgi:hypothetical protein
VEVGVDEAWHHRASVRVDHLGRAASEALDVTVRADAEDLVVTDRQRFGDRLARSGEERAVIDDDVDWARPVVTLRADNQAGSDRDDDDERDDDGGETRLHSTSGSIGAGARVGSAWIVTGSTGAGGGNAPGNPPAELK